MTSNDLLKSEKGGWGGRGAVSSGLFVLLNSMIKKICRPKGRRKKLFFFTFGQKGGVLANPKNPYQKILRWSKRGEL